MYADLSNAEAQFGRLSNILVYWCDRVMIDSLRYSGDLKEHISATPTKNVLVFFEFIVFVVYKLEKT